MKRLLETAGVEALHKKKLEETNETDCSDAICSPISTLSDVWNYSKEPPQWVKKIVDLKPRSNFVIQNSTIPCHVESYKFNPSERLYRNMCPRTLVCHDMKGGYIEDKYVEPTNLGNGYAFYRWSQIDIFVYFSHHLITIPPLSWINAAHNNGVKILGTFITEWKPGKKVCDEIFVNSETITSFVNELVDICILFKLDGWLLNIENEIDNTENLILFVKQLTEAIHVKHPGSLIIWYDSVISDGKLKWQNELNHFNSCYFDQCDGIFLNYSWNEGNLANSLKAAQHRRLDVYVGVDVFGRNFFGGGNFNTYLAVEKIRKYNLSMAIFAQGWTHETLKPEPSDTILERFLVRDNVFWKTLWPYLYTHPINNTFETFFYVGVDKDWFKLHSQEIQLSQFLVPNEKLEDASSIERIPNTCNCLQLHCQDAYTSCCITNKIFNSLGTYVHHLFSCDINVTSPLALYCYYKVEESRNEFLDLILLVQNQNGSIRKVVCHGHNNNKERSNNNSLLEVLRANENTATSMIVNRDKVPSDWILGCYLLELKDCKILEIGATVSGKSSICLCGIGIKAINN